MAVLWLPPGLYWAMDCSGFFCSARAMGPSVMFQPLRPHLCRLIHTHAVVGAGHGGRFRSGRSCQQNVLYPQQLGRFASQASHMAQSRASHSGSIGCPADRLASQCEMLTHSSSARTESAASWGNPSQGVRKSSSAHEVGSASAHPDTKAGSKQ